MNLNLGLMAYYPFSGNANDASGNGNNPIFNNATLTADHLGNPNSAYLFNGIDNYIQIPNSPTLNMANQISICAYVEPLGFYHGACHGNSVMMKGDADFLPGNYGLRFDDDVYTSGQNCSNPVADTIHETFFDLAGSQDHSQYMQKGEWYCVVFTYDGSTSSMYVDGVLRDSESNPGLSFTNSYDLFLGHLNNSTFPYWFNGVLDEVRIYNRPLNGAEVTALCGLLCTPLSGSLSGSNICVGDSKAFLTFHDGTQAGPFTLTYTDGSNTYQQTNVLDNSPFQVQVVPSSTTLYSVLSIQDTTGCTATLAAGPTYNASISVEKTVVIARPDTSVCPGISVQLSASGAATYSWSPAANLSDPGIPDPLASPISTTSFVVAGQSADGCTGTDTVVVAIFAPIAKILTQDSSICTGSQAQLNATGGTVYTWSPTQYLDNPASASPVARPVATTTFFLQVLDNNNCSEKDSVKITLLPVPVFHPPGDANLCKGMTVMLGYKNAGQYDYTWSPAASLDDPNSGAPIANPDSTTIYTVTITDPVCHSDSTFTSTVSVHVPPVVSAQRANDIDCSQAQSRLNATGAVSYVWSPAIGLSDPAVADPIVNIDSTTTFSVLGTDNNGCSGIDTVTIKVTNTGKNLFVVPNSFSPNGDGHNDCFGIQRWGNVQIVEFSVFDRWGVRVFTTRNPSECWDGNFRGKPQMTGAYAYVIKASSFCGEITRTGLVMLIR